MIPIEPFRICRAAVTAVMIGLILTAGLSAAPVVISGNRLSVQADGVPLPDLLYHISKYGVEVKIDPSINRIVTCHFIDRDIQDGLASILKPYSYALIWGRLDADVGQLPVLSEIQVYKPGNKAAMERLKQRRNLSITHDPKTGHEYVSSEVLLRLKGGVDLAAFHRFLADANGTIVDSHRPLGIYRVRLPDDAAVPSFVEEAKRHPVVDEIEPNFAYPIGSPAYLSGSGYLASATVPARAVRGGAPIAVLDTGIDSEGNPSIRPLGSFNAVDPPSPVSDPLGHGTQMAYIASGLIQPDGIGGSNEEAIPVVPIRVFDDNGYTSNDTILRATEYAIAQGAAVMSLSWGSGTKSGLLEEILAYAVSKGMVVVASAGNEPTGEPVYPAAYTEVIGVGALSPDGKAWEKSNHGDFVAAYAPGFASLPVGYKGDPGKYAGTSIAAAYAANRISHLLSLTDGRTDDDVSKLLKELKSGD